jgi:hypothetical protein
MGVAEMAYAQTELDRAFNAGSDARLLGIPLTQNPYIGTPGLELYRLWRHGWLHVSRCYGIDVEPRPQLPPVQNAVVNTRPPGTRRPDLLTALRAMNITRVV